MSGNFTMESVATFVWNRWQLSYGTGGNFRAEYAPEKGNVSSGVQAAFLPLIKEAPAKGINEAKDLVAFTLA
jgi:hypothetical protein